MVHRAGVATIVHGEYSEQHWRGKVEAVGKPLANMCWKRAATNKSQPRGRNGIVDSLEHVGRDIQLVGSESALPTRVQKMTNSEQLTTCEMDAEGVVAERHTSVVQNKRVVEQVLA